MHSEIFDWKKDSENLIWDEYMHNIENTGYGQCRMGSNFLKNSMQSR